MSRSIDQRIVDMKFNNQEFESGIKESLKSMDDLKRGLTSMDGASSGLESLKVGFSSLGVIGATVLSNLTTAAMEFGSKLLNIATGPIQKAWEAIDQGGSRRAANLEQARFMFQGLGVDVEEAMNNSLEAVRGTAYGLDEAAKAAAQLSASGIALGDDMTFALRGIAGTAAMTNSGFEDIARIFTTVSGQGKLMTEQLRMLEGRGLNAAAVIAEQLGKTEAEVRAMVTDGQINFEMFSNAMSEAFGEQATRANETYSGSLSNVNAALARIGAAVHTPRLEYMRDIFNSLQPVIDNLAAALDPLINKINETGRAAADFAIDLLDGLDLSLLPPTLTNVVDTIDNVFGGLADILKPIKEAFTDIFPPITAQRLLEISESVKNLTAQFKINDETADNIRRTFAGLFAAVDLVRVVLTSIARVAFDLVGVFIPMGDGILGVTAGLGDFVVALRNAVVDGDIFGRGVEAIGNVLAGVRDVIQNGADGIRDGIQRLKDYFSQFGGVDLGPLKTFGKDVDGAFTPFTLLAGIFKSAWDSIVSVFQWIAPIIIPIAQKVASALTTFTSKIGEAVRSGDLKSLLDVVNTGLLGSLVLGLRSFVDSLGEIGSGASGVLGGITNIIDGVGGSLEAFQGKLKADALMKIALAIGILSAALLVLSTIDEASMSSALTGITILFTDLAAIMLVLGKNMNSVKLGTVAVQMIAISAAVLILASAMKKLADIDSDDLTKGGAAIAALSVILVKSAQTLSQSSGRLIKGATGLVAFSAAVLVLAQAVKQLGALDLASLGKGLLGLGAIIYEVAAFTQMVKAEKLISTGVAMIAMGAGLLVISQSVKQLGSLDLGSLAKGLLGLGVVLVEISAFTQMVKTEKLISTGVAMIAMGAALTILSSSVVQLGSLNVADLVKGLSGLGVALAEMAAFTRVVKPEKMISTGVAMIAMGAALKLIAGAVQSLGSMSWSEMAVGLIAMAGALLAITLAANAMTGAVAGAAAMIIMAGAIALLAPALATLGSMNLSSVGIALLALAGVFVVLGAAGVVLAPLTPAILALAGAVALLGVGALAIGAGLLAFSVGLTTLAAGGAAAAAGIAVIVMTLVELIPAAVIALAEGLVGFIEVIGDSVPEIMNAIRNLVRGLIEVLVDLTPDLVAAIFVFVGEMMDALLDNVPELLETGIQLLLAVLEGISKNMKDIIVVALDIITEFLQGLADGLPDVIGAAVDIVIALADTIGNETPRLVDAAFEMIIDFVNGLADAIRENTGPLVESFTNLAAACIEGLVDGIMAGIETSIKAIKDLGSNIIDGFKSVMGIASPSKVFTEFGENTTEGYVNGVEGSADNAEDATKRMADLAIKAAYDKFDIASGKSNVFKELGVTNAESFVEGLNVMGAAVKESIEKTFAVDEKQLKLAFGTDNDGLQQALADNKAYVEGMVGMIDEALSTIEQRLTSYTDLANDRFNRINTESEVSVAEMISNLKHNQLAIAEWADNISKLAERGLNEGLLEELRKAGPASAGEVKALVAASDAELQELNTVMGRSGAVATQALITSVGEAPPLMIQEGQSITDALAQGLSQTTSVNEAMALLIQQTKDTAIANLSGTEFQEMGKNITDGLGEGISQNTEGAVSAAESMASAVKSSTEGAFGIASPSKVYNEYGMNLMAGLEQGIATYSDKPISAIETMFTKMETAANASGAKVAKAAETGLKSNDAVFGATGTKYGTDFSNMLANKQTAANTSGRAVTTRAEEGVKYNADVFGRTGTKYGEDFANELSRKSEAAREAGRKLAKAAEEGLKENAAAFQEAGKAAGEGFAKGLEEALDAAIEIARRKARAAKDAIEDELDIRSPSRVLYATGRFAGLGFVNGLRDMGESSAQAGATVGEEAIDGMRDAISRVRDLIDGEVDTTITITPVIDLSEVQNGINSLDGMLDSSVRGVTPTTTNVARISSQMAEVVESRRPRQESEASSTSEIKYEFNQNNYSPKSLSRLEIYRQTKNLLTQQKGVAEGA